MPLANGLNVGVVLMYDRFKKFGFIIDEENPDQPDIFVHFSAIVGQSDQRYLMRGQKVVFRTTLNPRTGKMMAVDVIRLADPLVDPSKIKPSPLDALGSKSPKTGGTSER
jgi:cold shock CspA family protein